MEPKSLKYVYHASDKNDAPTFLLLHGTGGDEHDLVPLTKDFGMDFNILSVRGNVSENGMPRFFRRLSMGVFDEEDLHFRTDELVGFVKELSEIEHFDSNKIVALGYSNGANIAGAILMKYPDFLAGAILYRPMLPFANIGTFSNTTNAPVLMTSGRNDSMTSEASTSKYTELLKNAGFNVEARTLNASHGLTEEDILLTKSWLNEKFAR